MVYNCVHRSNVIRDLGVMLSAVLSPVARVGFKAFDMLSFILCLTRGIEDLVTLNSSQVHVGEAIFGVLSGGFVSIPAGHIKAAKHPTTLANMSNLRDGLFYAATPPNPLAVSSLDTTTALLTVSSSSYYSILFLSFSIMYLDEQFIISEATIRCPDGIVF